MPKEMSLSLEGREQKADAPTHNGARPHGKVRDFATRPQTHQYTKGDYFTLRSGERVLRLRGGGDFDDYGDSYNTGWNDDSYNTGWNNDPYRYEDTYNTGWDGDTYNTERDNDPYRYEDTYRYEELYKYEDPYRYEDPSDQWRKEPASTSDIYSEAIELLRERPGNMGDERRESDADPYRASWSLQQWAEELSSTRILSNAELEQLRECLLNEGNESRRGSGDKDGHHVVNSDEYDGGYSREELEAAREELEQRLRMLEIRDGVVEEEQHDGGEHDGGQGDGNGGGDGGNRGVRDGDDSSNAAPTDLSAVRAAYSELDAKLLLIEGKLNVEGHADTFQIIEHVSQEERIIGFDRWVYRFAEHDADHMFGHVMELAEAQRQLQNILMILM